MSIEGGVDVLASKRKVAKLIEHDADLGDHSDIYSMSKHERYIRASERHIKAFDNLKSQKLAGLSRLEKRIYMSLAIGPDGSPIAIQVWM